MQLTTQVQTKGPIHRARAMVTTRTWMKSKSMTTTKVHAQVNARFAIGMPSIILVAGETNANSVISALGYTESDGASDSQAAG